MKRLTLHRLASALLCLTLALSLTACGGKKKPAPAAGNGGVKETISGRRGLSRLPGEGGHLQAVGLDAGKLP